MWDIPDANPRQFALSALQHVIALEDATAEDTSTDAKVPLEAAYPIGTIVDNAKVVRVDSDRGLTVEINGKIRGFVHVRVPYRRCKQRPHHIYRSPTHQTNTFQPCPPLQALGSLEHSIVHA